MLSLIINIVLGFLSLLSLFSILIIIIIYFGPGIGTDKKIKPTKKPKKKPTSKNQKGKKDKNR
jgi:hypothetical protein